MGNGSDHPAVLTPKGVELHFGMRGVRFDRSKRSLLAADEAFFSDDVLDPHMNLLPPYQA
jgi:hypothetical protein